MKSSISLESDLIAPVCLYFFNQGGIILREVRLGFCRADLVVFTMEGTVIAVELKLVDWKKAFIQAQNYLLAADLVYVAFPLKKKSLIQKKVLSALVKKGIGVLFVDPSTKRVIEFLKPVHSSVQFGVVSLAELKRRKKTRSVPYRLF